MNKIINRGATVAMYISTVTVARVEIYIFLHNFKSTDVEYFWVKIYKKKLFFLFCRIIHRLMRMLLG